MQFLKILFWCLLAFIAAVFTIANWATVPIRLWGGLIADVNLPMLLLVTFLVGFVPTALYNLALRWRLRQRLATAERTILDLRTAQTPPAGAYPAAATPVRTSPAAAPTIPASASTTTTIAPVPSTTL
ncbi:LapA family protein [Sphingomonas sp. 22R3R2A-7]|uniref:LapA family protein n=1 Tax=Sphingomonas sp. 22R3R2A-7 TaxID=3050230 RepID=UPI002FE221A6